MAVVLCLTTRWSVMAFSLVSIGTLNESIVHPREVFRPAIAMGAYAVILMHNHPSGSIKPSQSDISLTRTLANCALNLQISLKDHIIVTPAPSGFFSFADNYML